MLVKLPLDQGNNLVKKMMLRCCANGVLKPEEECAEIADWQGVL